MVNRLEEQRSFQEMLWHSNGQMKTKDLGMDAGLKGKFGLSDKASMEIMKLFFTPDEDLYDKPITDFFDDDPRTRPPLVTI